MEITVSYLPLIKDAAKLLLVFGAMAMAHKGWIKSAVTVVIILLIISMYKPVKHAIPMRHSLVPVQEIPRATSTNKSYAELMREEQLRSDEANRGIENEINPHPTASLSR